jgi:hypothetical protein
VRGHIKHGVWMQGEYKKWATLLLFYATRHTNNSVVLCEITHQMKQSRLCIQANGGHFEQSL